MRHTFLSLLDFRIIDFGGRNKSYNFGILSYNRSRLFGFLYMTDTLFNVTLLGMTFTIYSKPGRILNAVEKALRKKRDEL